MEIEVKTYVNDLLGREEGEILFLEFMILGPCEG